MFNANNMLTLLKTRPFGRFRFVLSDGGTVEVETPNSSFPADSSPSSVCPTRTPSETFIDWWITVWYMHITRVEQTAAGRAALLHRAARPGGIAHAVVPLIRLPSRGPETLNMNIFVFFGSADHPIKLEIIPYLRHRPVPSPSTES